MHFSCSGNPKQFGQTLITRESLELGPELGQGEFGSVLKGIWTDPKGDKVSLECLSHDKTFCNIDNNINCYCVEKHTFCADCFVSVPVHFFFLDSSGNEDFAS